MRIYYLMFFLIFSSCIEEKINVLSQKKIECRSFLFGNDKINYFKVKKTQQISKESIYYIYEYDNNIDTLQINSKKITSYNSKILKEIDLKEIIFNKKTYNISKFLYSDSLNYKLDKHIYVEKDIGVIFIQNLNTGKMYEYEINYYCFLHEIIANNKVNFTDGPFEPIYASKNYIRY